MSVGTTDDGHPIYVFLIGNPPKYAQYLELTIQAIKYVKKHVKNANIGIISPVGTEDLTTVVKDRLKEVNPNGDVENIHWVEGRQHFNDWDNTQRILDAEFFTEEFDPIIFLDSDSVVIQDVSPTVHDFRQSGKKFGFINSYVPEYPKFEQNWKVLKFVPSTSFQIYSAAALVGLIPTWKKQWQTWIEPAPFVNNKDPARFYKNSKITIGQYALTHALLEYSPNFDADVFEIPRHSVKLARNLGIETQKIKRKFLGDGSSFSNDGPMRVTVKVKSASLNDPADTSVSVNVGDWERSTKVVKDTNEPVWDQEYVFDDSTYAAANDIVFTVYDNPKPVAKTRSFGGPYTGPAQVTIDVVSGVIYKKHDVVGEDDPYVKVKIGGVEKETKHLENTNNPAWNETLTFDGVVSDDAQAITIEVYDWDRFTKHDLVGTATVDLLPSNGNKQHLTVSVTDQGVEEAKIELDVLLAPEDSATTREFVAPSEPTKEPIGTARLSLVAKKTNEAGVPGPLSASLPLADSDGTQKGTLEVEGEFYVQLLPEEEEPKQRSFAAPAAPAVGGPWEGQAVVTLNIASAEIYKKHDVVGEDDPYVKVSIGGVEKQTNVQKDTAKPEWNETLTFDDVVVADANITVTIWDWDRFTKHDLIGTANLDILPYNGNKQRVTLSATDGGVEEAKIEVDVLVTPGK